MRQDEMLNPPFWAGILREAIARYLPISRAGYPALRNRYDHQRLQRQPAPDPRHARQPQR